MPNWCFNKLCIKKEYLDKVVKDGEVSFSIIAPMPDIFEILISDNAHRIAKAFYQYKLFGNKNDLLDIIKDKNATDEDINAFINEMESKYTTISEDDYFRKIDTERLKKCPTLCDLGKLIYETEKKYGCSYWYDWRIKNWGTKWDACDSDINYFTVDNTEMVEINFDTAWCPPEGWLSRLSKECPFYLEWIEEQGYHGEYLSDGKRLTSNELEMEHWVEDGDDWYVENEDIYTFEQMKLEVVNW